MSFVEKPDFVSESSFDCRDSDQVPSKIEYTDALRSLPDIRRFEQ